MSTTTTTRPKSENENDRDAKVTRCIYLTNNLRRSKPHSKENITDNPEITFHSIHRYPQTMSEADTEDTKAGVANIRVKTKREETFFKKKAQLKCPKFFQKAMHGVRCAIKFTSLSSRWGENKPSRHT